MIFNAAKVGQVGFLATVLVYTLCLHVMLQAGYASNYHLKEKL